MAKNGTKVAKNGYLPYQICKYQNGRSNMAGTISKKFQIFGKQ